MNEIGELKKVHKRFELSSGFEERVFQKIRDIKRRRRVMTAAGLFLAGLISLSLIKDGLREREMLISNQQRESVERKEKPVNFALEQIHLVSSNQNGNYLVEEMQAANIKNSEI